VIIVVLLLLHSAPLYTLFLGTARHSHIIGVNFALHDKFEGRFISAFSSGTINDTQMADITIET